MPKLGGEPKPPSTQPGPLVVMLSRSACRLIGRHGSLAWRENRLEGIGDAAGPSEAQPTAEAAGPRRTGMNRVDSFYRRSLDDDRQRPMLHGSEEAGVWYRRRCAGPNQGGSLADAARAECRRARRASQRLRRLGRNGGYVLRGFAPERCHRPSRGTAAHGSSPPLVARRDALHPRADRRARDRRGGAGPWAPRS